MKSKIKFGELKDFLDAKVSEYNVPAFIKDDPISIPHRFSTKEDIEISAFLIATISWGQRGVILSNGARMMQLMEEQPYQFVMEASTPELKKIKHFVHRTFNGIDAVYFMQALRNIYRHHNGLEQTFSKMLVHNDNHMGYAISGVRELFFSELMPGRTAKHFSDPSRNSAAKRINMFLRWMVRKDKTGVDFGIWKTISPELLFCPLDVHSGRVARKLGLLQRTQDDWKSVEELTDNLRKLDPKDPVKYDFALFGLGVYEKF